MNKVMKHLAIASAVSLMAIASAGAVSAQPKDSAGAKVETQHVQKKWKFNKNRHERRHRKDDRFRFYFGGFWHPQPYWLGYGFPVNQRVSCGEGRAIVDARGFNRVRTLECRGAAYTYLGRRHGDDFKVVLNARTGRIIDVDRV
jgi:hypothetical protein